MKKLAVMIADLLCMAFLLSSCTIINGDSHDSDRRFQNTIGEDCEYPEVDSVYVGYVNELEAFKWNYIIDSAPQVTSPEVARYAIGEYEKLSEYFKVSLDEKYDSCVNVVNYRKIFRMYADKMLAKVAEWRGLLSA